MQASCANLLFGLGICFANSVYEYLNFYSADAFGEVTTPQHRDPRHQSYFTLNMLFYQVYTINKCGVGCAIILAQYSTPCAKASHWSLKAEFGNSNNSFSKSSQKWLWIDGNNTVPQ